MSVPIQTVKASFAPKKLYLLLATQHPARYSWRMEVQRSDPFMISSISRARSEHVVPSGTPNGLTVIISVFSLGTSSQFSQRQQDDDKDDDKDASSAADPLFNNVNVDNTSKIAETHFMVMYSVESSVLRERR